MGSKALQRDTHFVCFPLVTRDSATQLASSLAYFRDVTTVVPMQERAAIQGSNLDTNLSDGVRIIPSIAHRPPGTFHLTLGTMNLSNPKRMEAAMSLMQEIDYESLLKGLEISTKANNEPVAEPDTTDFKSGKEVTDQLAQVSNHITESSDTTIQTSSHITVTLHGLGAFSSPTNARVFYAHPRDPSGRLLEFASAIRQKFKDAGFIMETRPLVLHATVANMSYAKWNKRYGRGGKQGRRNDKLDATEIVRLFDEQPEELTQNGFQGQFREEYIWAQDIVIDRVRLCKMGAEKAEDEVLGLEYRPVAEKMIFDNT